MSTFLLSVVVACVMVNVFLLALNIAIGSPWWILMFPLLSGAYCSWIMSKMIKDLTE